VLAGERAAGVPKSGDGCVEMIRVLRAARRAAVRRRERRPPKPAQEPGGDGPRRAQGTPAQALSTKALVATAVRFRPGGSPGNPEEATRFARSARWLAATDHSRRRSSSSTSSSPDWLRGWHPDSWPCPASARTTRLYAACGRGGQPREVEERSVLRQPLRGLARVEASSGKVVRHRLNRGGNRDANRALHLICVVRMRVDERTRRYVARRSAEGKSKQEIMRCLKRYVAREVYRVLVLAASPSLTGSCTRDAT